MKIPFSKMQGAGNDFVVLDETKGLFNLSRAQYQFLDMSIHSAYTAIPNELATFNLIDPYITAVYNSDFGFNLNAGARLNIHSKYGSNFVYNINK